MRYCMSMIFLLIVSGCFSTSCSKELSSKKAILATNLRNLQYVLRTKREDGECVSYIRTHTLMHVRS